MINAYNEYIKKNYNKIKTTFQQYAFKKKMPFLEDDFHQVLLDVYTSIEKGNFKKEPTDKNFDNYLFISYQHQAQKHLNHNLLNTHSIDESVGENKTYEDIISSQIDDYNIYEECDKENIELTMMMDILNSIESVFGRERRILYCRFLRGEKLSDIKDIENPRGKYLETLYYLQSHLDYNKLKNNAIKKILK